MTDVTVSHFFWCDFTRTPILGVRLGKSRSLSAVQTD